MNKPSKLQHRLVVLCTDYITQFVHVILIITAGLA